MRRFRSPPLSAAGDVLVLDAAVSHHLLRVVQLPRGDRVLLFDGQGAEAAAELVDGSDGLARLRLLEDPRPAAPTRMRVLLAGLPRKPAWDHALRMATELGATEIRGFVAHRSVVKKGRPDRWQRVVEAATGQCGRGDVPALSCCSDLAGALVGPLPQVRRVLVPGAAPARPVSDDAALLVGPEGGLTEGELALAAEAGFEAVGLGSWVLRTDTAIAAALAVL